MCLSHRGGAVFNMQFVTNCAGLLIPSAALPHCFFMPAHLHLVIAILGPTAQKDSTVCHIHSFKPPKCERQPCAVAAKTKLGQGWQAGTSPWFPLELSQPFSLCWWEEQENMHCRGQCWLFLDIPPPTALQLVQKKQGIGPDFKR